MSIVIQPRARIVPDVRYPSGGYFNAIPAIEKTGASLSDFAEKTGFVWYVLSESGRLDTEYVKKSNEVWLLDGTRQATHDPYNLTTIFGYDNESDGSFVSGFSRRPFCPYASAYTGIGNIYCRSMEDLTSSIGSGYVFDRRHGLKMEVYDFSGVLGHTQYLVYGLTGSIVVTGTSYAIPDSLFDYSPIINNLGNVVASTSGIFGFSGTMSSPDFDYNRNGIDNVCSGRLYFDNTGSVGRYSQLFSYPTGFETLVFKDEDGFFSDITGYYIEGRFTGRLTSTAYPFYPYVTKRPNLTGIVDKYPFSFFNDSGYYRFITGHFINGPAASSTGIQMPYVTVALNDYFSGETRYQLFKDGQIYQTFLSSDVFTGDSRTGWHELNDLTSGTPNEYKGVLPSGSPQTIPTANDLTLNLQSQILYRDYSVAPGLSYRYDSRVITDFTDQTSGVSSYSFDEYASYPLKTQSGKYYYSETGGPFHLITGLLYINSSILDFTGTIASLSNSQLPLSSATTTGKSIESGIFAGNIFVNRCRDIINFTYSERFQTGNAPIAVRFPSNHMYNSEEKVLPILWYDSTSSMGGDMPPSGS